MILAGLIFIITHGIPLTEIQTMAITEGNQEVGKLIIVSITTNLIGILDCLVILVGTIFIMGLGIVLMAILIMVVKAIILVIVIVVIKSMIFWVKMPYMLMGSYKGEVILKKNLTTVEVKRIVFGINANKIDV
jgi:hypothetical protein